MIELPPGRPLVTSDELNRLIRQQRIGWLIGQAMIIDQVARSVTLEASEVERLISEFLEAQNFSGADARATYLESSRISEDDLIWRATTDRRLQIHRLNQYGPDVETHYLERKLNLDQVIYSMIRVRDPDLAFELYQQIQEGEADFPTLASQYSEGQERGTHGRIGPVPLGVAHTDLVNRLRSAQPGQLIEPFLLVDVWLIVRLEQYLPAQLDEALRRKLEEEMFNTWLTEQVHHLLAGGELPILHGMPGPSA